MPSTRKRLNGPGLGGLLATRRGALALALVCALAATGILLFAINKYRHAVAGNTKQDTVLVSTAEIPKGSPANMIASQQLYKVTPVLASQVSPGAIVDAASLNGEIAATNILPGQQLTAADFTTPSGSSGGSVAQLTPVQRAVSVALDPQHGLSDVLEAGDSVDVYGSYAAIAKGVTGQIVSLLEPDVEVLKVSSASGGASGAGTVLLALNMALAPRVTWMADNGKIWLELRGFNAAATPPTVTGNAQISIGNHLATGSASTSTTTTSTTTTGTKR